MRFTWRTLGTLVTAHTVAVATAAAAQSGGKTASAVQGAGPTACSMIDAEELKRLTGLTDLLKQGPVPTDPADLPKGRTECEYLGFTFSLSSVAGREAFDRSRTIVAKDGTKVESVSGVGDDAFYWWDARPGSMNQVGIAVRSGNRQLTVLDLASSDSIAAVKPRLLAVAKSLAPKLR